MPRYFRHYKNGNLYELLQIARIEADPDKKAVKERFLTIVSALFLLISIVGCHSRKGDTPLFKDAALQDSLLCFLERIDSIPNSYGAPSLYVVSFWLKGQDSLIRFSANSELWKYNIFVIDTKSFALDDSLYDDYNTLPPPPGVDIDSVWFRTPNWIGLYRYGNKHVLIESDWDSSQVINMSVLEPWEPFEHLYHYEDPLLEPDCDLTDYHYSCERTYRFQSPGNVRLVRRRIGKADPDYKDRPKTIEYE